MTTVIELTLSARQWAAYQRGRYDLDTEKAVRQIRAEHRKWGGDWGSYSCRILAPTGELLREVRWAPLFYTMGGGK